MCSVLTFIPPCCVIYRWSDDPIVVGPVTRQLLPGQQPNKWLSSPVSIISTISPAGNLRCSSSSLLSSSSSPHNQFQTKQHSPNWPSPYTNQTVPSVVGQWNCKNRDSQVLDKIINAQTFWQCLLMLPSSVFCAVSSTWIFQYTPNICILDEFEGSYGYFSKKRHFFWDTL